MVFWPRSRISSSIRSYWDWSKINSQVFGTLLHWKSLIDSCRRYRTSNCETWRSNVKNTNWECYWLASPFCSYVASPSKSSLTSTKSYFVPTRKATAPRHLLSNFVSTSRICWFASTRQPILSFTFWEEKSFAELGVKLICVERRKIQEQGKILCVCVRNFLEKYLLYILCT